jgi:Flp pilus assembly pilin Flp
VIDITLVECTGTPVPVEERGLPMLDELRAGLAVEAGQTMAEYAVVLGVITIAVVVTLGLLSSAVQSLLTNVISVI